MHQSLSYYRRWLLLALLTALLGGYWLLPIRGQLLILSEPDQRHAGVWPQVWVEPGAARAGEPVTIYVRDTTPWSHVKLLLDGAELPRDEGFAAGNGPWTWRWPLRMPAAPAATAVFYHDCHTGCVERTRVVVGDQSLPDEPSSPRRATKLGVVFADPARDWHGRAGWAVELTYVQRQADDVDFSIDGLARRVYLAQQKGLRVLVRVAYDARVVCARVQRLWPGTAAQRQCGADDARAGCAGARAGRASGTLE